MKHVWIIPSLLIIGVFLSGQVSYCVAQSTIQILNVTTIDTHWKASVYVNRGMQEHASVEINCQNAGNFIITSTLYDTCNTPAGYAASNVHLSAGKNTVMLNFSVTNYAFVGMGILHINVLSVDYTPVVSYDANVYIRILGDFDKNNVVTSTDISFLMSAYQYYWTYKMIPLKYQPCDLNGDNKIDVQDLTIFVVAYQTYWSNPY